MTAYLSMYYDERDSTSSTGEVNLQGDTRPGQIIPFPVAGPSFAPKFREVSDKDCVLSAITIYYNSMRMTA